jgi:hypothetical protein
VKKCDKNEERERESEIIKDGEIPLCTREYTKTKILDTNPFSKFFRKKKDQPGKNRFFPKFLMTKPAKKRIFSKFLGTNPAKN